jgi:hypothetical protein
MLEGGSGHGKRDTMQKNSKPLTAGEVVTQEQIDELGDLVRQMNLDSTKVDNVISAAGAAVGLTRDEIGDLVAKVLDFKPVVTFDDNGSQEHHEQLLMNDAGQLVVKDKDGCGRIISLRDSLFWIGQRVVSEKAYSWPYESMAKYFKMVAGAFGEEGE